MARLDDRGGRDSAGFGPYHRPDQELVPMRELGDWQLSDGEPDIRGWEVRTVGGRSIGTVRDLLVDRAAREVVLLDLDLADGNRRARAPIRAAQIDRVARVIRMDSADLLGETADAERLSSSATAGEREVERPVATESGLIVPGGAGVPDRADLDRDGVPDRAELSGRDRDLPDDRLDRDREAERRADSGVDETVVERRPLVYEEVVVRRRKVDPDSPESDRLDADRADADRRDERL